MAAKIVPSTKKLSRIQFVRVKNPKIGRRTGIDITEGKNIRVDEDGRPVFTDYWTDSELNETIYTKENDVHARNITGIEKKLDTSIVKKKSPNKQDGIMDKTLPTSVIGNTAREETRKSSPTKSTEVMDVSKTKARMRLFNNSEPNSTNTSLTSTRMRPHEKSILMIALEEQERLKSAVFTNGPSRISQNKEGEELDDNLVEFSDFSEASEDHFKLVDEPIQQLLSPPQTVNTETIPQRSLLLQKSPKTTVNQKGSENALHTPSNVIESALSNGHSETAKSPVVIRTVREEPESTDEEEIVNLPKLKKHSKMVSKLPRLKPRSKASKEHSREVTKKSKSSKKTNLKEVVNQSLKIVDKGESRNLEHVQQDISLVSPEKTKTLSKKTAKLGKIGTKKRESSDSEDVKPLLSPKKKLKDGTRHAVPSNTHVLSVKSKEKKAKVTPPKRAGKILKVKISSSMIERKRKIKFPAYKQFLPKVKTSLDEITNRFLNNIFNQPSKNEKATSVASTSKTNFIENKLATLNISPVKKMKVKISSSAMEPKKKLNLLTSERKSKKRKQNKNENLLDADAASRSSMQPHVEIFTTKECHKLMMMLSPTCKLPVHRNKKSEKSSDHKRKLELAGEMCGKEERFSKKIKLEKKSLLFQNNLPDSNRMQPFVRIMAIENDISLMPHVPKDLKVKNRYKNKQSEKLKDRERKLEVADEMCSKEQTFSKKIELEKKGLLSQSNSPDFSRMQPFVRIMTMENDIALMPRMSKDLEVKKRSKEEHKKKIKSEERSLFFENPVYQSSLPNSCHMQPHLTTCTATVDNVSLLTPIVSNELKVKWSKESKQTKRLSELAMSSSMQPYVKVFATECATSLVARNGPTVRNVETKFLKSVKDGNSKNPKTLYQNQKPKNKTDGLPTMQPHVFLQEIFSVFPPCTSRGASSSVERNPKLSDSELIPHQLWPSVVLEKSEELDTCARRLSLSGDKKGNGTPKTQVIDNNHQTSEHNQMTYASRITSKHSKVLTQRNRAILKNECIQRQPVVILENIFLRSSVSPTLLKRSRKRAEMMFNHQNDV